MKAAFVLFLALAACSDQTIDRPAPLPSAAPTETPPAPTTTSTAPPVVDAGADAPSTPTCTSTFGHALTNGYGRLDGTVRAVIVPTDKACHGDNDHVLLQIDVGAVTYPIAVNILSDIQTNDPDVRLGRTDAALVGPAWSVGWHTDATLDYPTSLGLHSASFTSTPPSTLASTMANDIAIGAKVSLYGYGYTGGDGVHKVHRNLGGDDGAIAILNGASAKWLLFHFSQQSF